MVEQIMNVSQTYDLDIDNNNIQKSDLFPDAQDGWTLYGDQDCPFCRKSKDLLSSISAKFRYINITKYGGRTHILNHLAELTNNQRTVPVIFYKGEFVGGYREMVQKLVSVIRNCNGTTN